MPWSLADGEYLSFDRLSAVSTAIASAKSADQSSLASSNSGRTARFGGGSRLGDESCAAPTLVTGPQEERMALEDVTEGPECF